MATAGKPRTRRILSSRTASPPQSDRYRVLTCVYETMLEYTVRQGDLNAIWRRDTGTPSNYLSEGNVPGDLPSGSTPTSPEFEGILDTSFGTDGYNLTSPGTYDTINCMVTQPDGKILVGGYATISGNTGFALARYNPDGSLDTSFGTAGYNVNTPGTGDGIQSMVLQPDGKILAGGYAQTSVVSGFALARYNSDGSLDTSFGTAGYNLITPGTNDSINCIVLQSDGKLLAGGHADVSGNVGFALACYNSDGSLDTSFGTNGYNFTTPGTTDGITYIILQSDGKILAGGFVTLTSGSNNTFALARYNSDGSLDTSFGTAGYNLDTPGTDDGILSLVLQSDGKVIAGGGATIGEDFGFVLARYNSDGSLDTSFGTDGYSLTTPGTYDCINCMVLQSDGKIIVGGYAYINSYVFALARYNSDVSLDTFFGTDGYNLNTPGSYDGIDCIVLQQDGTILVGGYATLAGTDDVFAIARYK